MPSRICATLLIHLPLNNMPLQISIEHPTKLFEKHIKEEGNDRLIFSGAFGIGKTYFLDKYFDSNKSKYVTIKLSPVNYSLSSNEDIFKLIKYDILVKLITDYELSLERESVSLGIAIGVVVPAKIDLIVKSLFGIMPVLNLATDSIEKAINACKDLAGIVEDIKDQQKKASQETALIDFKSEVIKMFQLETDYITEFLEKILNEISKQNNHALRVLVIDDLDRIDPEHIFRLFNIFSAHLDYHREPSQQNNSDKQEIKNKFGFDKIIFVCDIQNIRNIFHSKYGTDTDFTGYIDNEKDIHEATDRFIKHIQVPDNSEYFLRNGILGEYSNNKPGLVSLILSEMLLSGAVKMRRLQNRFKMYYEPSDMELIVFDNYSSSAEIWKLKGLVTIEVLSKILGGAEYLLRALKTTSKYKRSLKYVSKEANYSSYLLQHIIPVLDYGRHKFADDGDYKKLPSETGGFIEYKIMTSREQSPYYYAQLSGELNVNIFEYLIKTVELLINEGYMH
jgi:hypothetical protein